MTDGCIFCQIVRGKAPSFKVWEDEATYAFMDIFPMGDGHVLVIPKVHAANLFEMPEDTLVSMARSVRRVALAMKQVLVPDGMMLAQLNGSAAGQTVFHYHQHLIPRRQGDPFAMRAKGRGDDARLAQQASAIAAIIG